MRNIITIISALSLVGCTTLSALLQPANSQTIGVDIAQLESATSALNSTVLSLVQQGYIKKDSSTAKTISVILAGVNNGLSQAEKDYVAGDVTSAILAFDTAKSAYDAVSSQVQVIQGSKQ